VGGLPHEISFPGNDGESTLPLPDRAAPLRMSCMPGAAAPSVPRPCSVTCEVFPRAARVGLLRLRRRKTTLSARRSRRRGPSHSRCSLLFLTA